MKFVKNMKFNDSAIDGWTCGCGETYFDPEQAERVLLLNKLKKEKFTAKLGKIQSNLILRLPKTIEDVLDFHKGEEVEIQIDGKGIKVIPA